MRQILLVCSITLAAAIPGWSDQISLWSFDGSAVAPATSIAGTTAGDLTQVHLTAETGNALFFSAVDWPVGSYGDAYFQFSISPNAGVFIDFTNVTMDYVIGTNPSFTFELLSSADGFTTPVFSHNVPIAIGTFSDPLAAIGIQSSTVTFRFYGFVNVTAGQSGFYNGSMSFNGPADAVFTPEPASWMLIAGGLGMVGLWRHRRASVRS